MGGGGGGGGRSLIALGGAPPGAALLRFCFGAFSRGDVIADARWERIPGRELSMVASFLRREKFNAVSVRARERE